MKHYTISQGERPPTDPAPSGVIEDATGVTEVAVLGEDWPGLRPRLQVEVGARVARGQTLFTDRKHREVCFVAPVAGVVDSVTYGPRRSLDALILRLGSETDAEGVLPDRNGEITLRETLLSAGFWPAFRARPFGGFPAPEAVPEAIVVNAVRTAPQAPDPQAVLHDRLDAFRSGCELLTQLTDGPVLICQSPGSELGPTHERVQHASFSGTVAAGLPGTQIDRLCHGQRVWSIDYQDVAAIGHFFATGSYLAERVVSISGPMAMPPRVLRAPMGAKLADMVGGASGRIVAGGTTTGRDAAFLGRFHDQVSLLPAAGSHRYLPRTKGHSAAIPSRALETAIALNVLPLPLLRALSIRDVEAAQRLGCLSLIEEDLAAATDRCTSGIDYGACLRDVLTDLMAEAA